MDKNLTSSFDRAILDKIDLKVPSIDDMKYRQVWLKDPSTMNYNAGCNVSYEGYNKIDGTITLTDDMLNKWYKKWINQEPNRFYAYIYVKNIDEPVGEVYYYPEDKYYIVGIMIHSKYRGNGYSLPALLKLEEIAFKKNNIPVLYDKIPKNRENAINLFKKAGFKIHDSKLIDKEIVLNLYMSNEMYKSN